jgi:ferredoxin
MSQKILMVYFSGTGGTERIANAFESELIKRNRTVIKVNLDRSKVHQQNQSNQYNGEIPKDFDMLLLIYPVYAFDVPPIVNEWICQSRADHIKAAVISVSGGGEAWPNTGCRNNCCKTLEEHGFDVFYEKMMVMPANCITPTKDQLSMWLLKAVPEKVNKVLDSLLQGKIRRTHFSIGPVKKYIAKSAKLNYHKFAEELKISERCNGCGLCSRSCPVGNITMKDEKPEYGSSCIMCLRCIYGCPQSAIKTKERIVFQNGFSIKKVEEAQEGKELAPVEELAKGWVWIGVRKYLLDEDGY